MGSGKGYENWKAFPIGDELKNKKPPETWLPLSLPVMGGKKTREHTCKIKASVGIIMWDNLDIKTFTLKITEGC